MCVKRKAYIPYCNHTILELCAKKKGKCRVGIVYWPMVGWCEWCLLEEGDSAGGDAEGELPQEWEGGEDEGGEGEGEGSVQDESEGLRSSEDSGSSGNSSDSG